jgi:hypothetical protein
MDVPEIGIGAKENCCSLILEIGALDDWLEIGDRRWLLSPSVLTFLLLTQPRLHRNNFGQKA